MAAGQRPPRLHSLALCIWGLYTGPPSSDPLLHTEDGVACAAADLIMQPVWHQCQISYFNSQLAIHFTKGKSVYIQNID